MKWNKTSCVLCRAGRHTHEIFISHYIKPITHKSFLFHFIFIVLYNVLLHIRGLDQRDDDVRNRRKIIFLAFFFYLVFAVKFNLIFNKKTCPSATRVTLMQFLLACISLKKDFIMCYSQRDKMLLMQAHVLDKYLTENVVCNTILHAFPFILFTHTFSIQIIIFIL